jgi:hypothetical protein
MLLFWRIRYLDTRDKEFKDRDLYLVTDDLDPVTRAAVEVSYQLANAEQRRDMLRYRHLFRELGTEVDLNALRVRYRGTGTVFSIDYFEDENGRELTSKQIAVTLTGSPTAFMVPAGAKQHYIDYMLADEQPIALDHITLSQEQLGVLGYFARDFRQLRSSTFYHEGPGVLHASEDDCELRTAVKDEEIQSFVMIFRRLYMKKEPANFLKALGVFEEALRGHPLADWIKGVAEEHNAELLQFPWLVPFAESGRFPFSRKRVIDVFLNTKYAHQPNEYSTRQFQECLAAVGGRQGVFTWVFLGELWACSLQMHSAGVIVADFYDRYCQHYKVSGNVLLSVATENPGIGILETKRIREQRILNEKTEELAKTMWEAAGRPVGGHDQFASQARAQLTAALSHPRSGTEK